MPRGENETKGLFYTWTLVTQLDVKILMNVSFFAEPDKLITNNDDTRINI